MPALVEIEVLRRDLEKEIVGRRIKEAEIRPGTNAMKVVPKHGRRKEFHDLLQGAKVDRAGRVGRKLLLELDGARTLMFDLGPSGRLLKTSASEPLLPHTHVVIGFTIGGQLRFVDPKLAGEVHATQGADVEQSKKDLRTFAIDPLEDHVTWNEFSAMVEDHDRPMRDLLLDESFLVGLGDIYADELLWHAGLRYDRSSRSLSSQDVRRLYRSIVEVLQDAVRARGTSLGEDGFQDLLGTPGGFQVELKVYGREGDACRRCRSPIVKENVDDAVAYLCSQCQS